MFGHKAKQASGVRVADSFEGHDVERSLRGEWLVFALSRFETSFTSRYDRSDSDFPVASGIVHFDHGTNVAIPAQLTLLENEPTERGRVGVAHYNSMMGDAGGLKHIVMEVAVNDPNGKVAKALQDAFDSAALSEERFVHVTFKRAKLDPAEHLPALKGNGYGAYHDLTEIQFKRRTQLAKTPIWSWLWTRDY